MVVVVIVRVIANIHRICSLAIFLSILLSSPGNDVVTFYKGCEERTIKGKERKKERENSLIKTVKANHNNKVQ